MNPNGEFPQLTPERFESALDAALQDERLEGEMRGKLENARQRLQNNPSLLVGGASGEFTYSDPILAQALYGIRLYLKAEPNVVRGGAYDGANLNSSAKMWGRWAMVGVGIFLNRHDPSLQSLAARIPAGPVLMEEKQPIRLAVVGDAGFSGVAQKRVLQMIRKRHQQRAFDAVIHLGDIYFAAGADEMLANFLGPFFELRNAGMKVYTLLGNHDLYYGAEAYEHALTVLQQPGRYFSIEGSRWRILCLDTSLFDDSLGRLNGQIDGPQLQWLEHQLSDTGDRGIIVMSHHYYVSAWKPGGDSLRVQLQHQMNGNVFAWYWGHEHACATYDRGSHGFYGACIGNGAFRERWRKPDEARAGYPSWYAEGRCKCYGADDDNHWPHGFLELELLPDSINETYHLEDGPEILHERTLRR